MKLGKFLFMSMLSGIVLTACVDNDDKSEWNDGSQPVSFTSSIKGVNTRAVDTKWTAGDKVGIFMKTANGDLSAAIAVNKLHTTDESGNLTASNADNALYYPANGSVDFIAYYPYTASLTDNTYKVDVATQTDQPSIDLLYSNNATNFAKGTASKPQLQFAHMLSQIVFNIEKDATIPSLNGLKVTFEGMNTKADFALANGALSNAGTVAKIDAVVNEASATAKTIVLPASALSGIKVVFALNGKSYTADYPQATLEGGSKYTHKVTLSDSNGQPVIEMEAATITGWTEVPGDDIEVDFGDGGVTPPDPTEGIEVATDKPYNETFADGLGGFTVDDVTEPVIGNPVWSHDANYHYMVASGRVGEIDYKSEGWLISPILKLADAQTVTLAFEHAFKFGSSADLTLQVKEVGQTWTAVTIPTYPTGGDWTFVSSGNIDLSGYVNKSIQFAFKYTSTPSSSAKWEIKNIKLTMSDGGTVDPPAPGVEAVIFEEDCGEGKYEKPGSGWAKVGAYSGWTNTNLTFTDGGGKGWADIRNTGTFDNHVWLPAYAADKASSFKITGFSTEGFTGLKLSYDIAVNKAGANQNIIVVKCNDVAVEIPSAPISSTSAYNHVEVDVADGITTIEFISNNTNADGYRIDNVKLVGTGK